jgi:hypothetical protein
MIHDCHPDPVLDAQKNCFAVCCGVPLYPSPYRRSLFGSSAPSMRE